MASEEAKKVLGKLLLDWTVDPAVALQVIDTALTAEFQRGGDSRDEEVAELQEPMWKPSDGDTICQSCGQPNPCWFAANEIWNRVVPERSGVLCPSCFIKRAELAGVGTKDAWKLVPVELRGNAVPTPSPKVEAWVDTVVDKYESAIGPSLKLPCKDRLKAMIQEGMGPLVEALEWIQGLSPDGRSHTWPEIDAKINAALAKFEKADSGGMLARGWRSVVQQNTARLTAIKAIRI